MAKTKQITAEVRTIVGKLEAEGVEPTHINKFLENTNKALQKQEKGTYKNTFEDVLLGKCVKENQIILKTRTGKTSLNNIRQTHYQRQKGTVDAISLVSEYNKRASTKDTPSNQRFATLLELQQRSNGDVEKLVKLCTKQQRRVDNPGCFARPHKDARTKLSTAFTKVLEERREAEQQTHQGRTYS